jgi:hypothetical protein
MRLIKEVNETVNILVEEKVGKGKEYFIEGIFLQAETVNRNNRRYGLNILGEEVQRYSKEYVEQNRAFGELGHPDSPTINLDRVSHMIKSLKLEGNNFIGKAKIMDTPNGRIVKALIDEGARLGVSSRGLGSLIQDKDGVNIVGKDFMLATAADIVADPSAPDAFVEAVMEGKEWIFVDGRFVEKDIESAKKSILATPRRDLSEQMIKEFNKFLSKL